MAAAPTAARRSSSLPRTARRREPRARPIGPSRRVLRRTRRPRGGRGRRKEARPGAAGRRGRGRPRRSSELAAAPPCGPPSRPPCWSSAAAGAPWTHGGRCFSAGRPPPRGRWSFPGGCGEERRRRAEEAGRASRGGGKRPAARAGAGASPVPWRLACLPTPLEEEERRKRRERRMTRGTH